MSPDDAMQARYDQYDDAVRADAARAIVMREALDWYRNATPDQLRDDRGFRAHQALDGELNVDAILARQ